MNQLLCKKQEIRLGGSFSVLKNHPWFAQFEWVIYDNYSGHAFKQKNGPSL